MAEDNLFALGEIVFESAIPVWDNLSIRIDAVFTNFGEAAFTLGWEAEF